MNDKARESVKREIDGKKATARKLNKMERETVRTAYEQVTRSIDYGLTAFSDTLETRIREFKLLKDSDSFSRLVSATYQQQTYLNELDRSRNTACASDIASSNTAFSTKVTYSGKPRTNNDVKPKSGKETRVARQRATIRKQAAIDTAQIVEVIPAGLKENPPVSNRTEEQRAYAIRLSAARRAKPRKKPSS